jgi:hypothetical protein
MIAPLHLDGGTNYGAILSEDRRCRLWRDVARVPSHL